MSENAERGKDAFPVGTEVDAIVTAEQPFGLLLDIGGCPGILERIQMERAGYRTPNEYPPVGSHITCTVLGFREWSQQIEVGLTRK